MATQGICPLRALISPVFLCCAPRVDDPEASEPAGLVKACGGRPAGVSVLFCLRLCFCSFVASRGGLRPAGVCLFVCVVCLCLFVFRFILARWIQGARWWRASCRPGLRWRSRLRGPLPLDPPPLRRRFVFCVPRVDDPEASEPAGLVKACGGRPAGVSVLFCLFVFRFILVPIRPTPARAGFPFWTGVWCRALRGAFFLKTRSGVRRSALHGALFLPRRGVWPTHRVWRSPAPRARGHQGRPLRRLVLPSMGGG